MEARQTHQLVAAVQSSPHIQSSPHHIYNHHHIRSRIYNKRTTYTIITYACIHTFPFLYQIFGYNRHHKCTCVSVLQFCGICSRANRIYNRVLKNHCNTMFSGGVVLFLRLMYKCQCLEPLMWSPTKYNRFCWFFAIASSSLCFYL